MQYCVIIVNENIFALTGFDASVLVVTESMPFCVSDDVNLRKLPFHHFDGAISRYVVYDYNLELAVGLIVKN